MAAKPCAPAGAGCGPLVAVLCALLLPACASQRTPDQIEELLHQAMRAAEAHHEFDQDPEASVLLEAIRLVHPGFPEAGELETELEQGADWQLERSPLGMNRKRRPHVDREPLTRALLWLPDRVLDLLDVVTVGVHLGTGAFADAHVTRAVQVVGGFRTTGGIGLHDFRSLGLKSQAEAGLTVIAVGTHAYGGALVGTSGTHSSTDEAIGVHSPMAPLYQELRDYWAIGANATAGILGVEVDFHPIQLADFFAGFVGLDLLNDDLAYTRGLRLDSVESRLLAELWDVRRSEDLTAYFETVAPARAFAEAAEGDDATAPPEAPLAPGIAPGAHEPVPASPDLP